ncbi:alpha/beta hydrolase [Streptomyces sp. NBC_01217]|uniref:alpha/beta hydrolase n=1 Tax=Streptomyces sp. NBC_01217 TaxID=2903779 RepID=UPI002E117B5C|nr:alpha/beta hydrolase [Streptomyces sp. NBC_01217]
MHRITLKAAAVRLSGLLSEPPQGSPRAVVIALHGGGMSAGYFDGQAHPDVSLLTLGASLGYTVLALDRPGYGTSAARLPDGQTLVEQAAELSAAIERFTSRGATGGGVLVLGHSFGGKLALTLAADKAPEGLLGLDISGCGHRLAVAPTEVHQSLGSANRRLNWGPLSLYPPDTFSAIQPVVAPVPPREVDAVGGWARLSAEILPRIRVPVRLTFAEHEAWWRHADEDLADLTARLSAAPRAVMDRMSGAGHNISLGRAARPYHLRAFAFLEECLAAPGRAADAEDRNVDVRR